jgi:parallel beta-helix repeat protein
MRNEMVDSRGAGKEMFYRNILIEENVILNAHLHGITVGETDGLVIRNNTVVRNAKASGEGGKPSLWTPRIKAAKASKNVRIERNVTAAVDGLDGQRDWVVADNLLVQDRSRMKPGFYALVFGPAALSAPELIESFTPLPGGPLDGTGIGAALLRKLRP